MDIKKVKKQNIKSNISGKITKSKYNYKGREVGLGLPKLFPEQSEMDMKVCGIKQNRVRYSEFPDELPTNGDMPYPPDEHEMIGEYEYPHNTYLIFANAYNKAMDKIEALEKEINKVKEDIK